MPEDSPLLDWARSGAMWLTGRRDGPPVASPGRPATAARDALAELTFHHPDAPLPDLTLLGERAAAAGLARRGPWSCGGAFRALPTLDGWLALSLPRASDVDLVPALLRDETSGDPWDRVAAWAARQTTRDAAARAHLLGLAAADLPMTLRDRPAVETTVAGTRRRHRERPRVVDLSSLWAGPLCAHLLGLCGADVVKVESTTRLDGARRGPAEFYDLLHAGHRAVVVDLSSADGLAALRRLMADADLVIEASRSRALAQLGIDAQEVVSDGTCWLSVTAYGRDQDRIGFGDDVAVGAGLHVEDAGSLLPCGDALADPLTGVTAAATAAAALAGEQAVLMDVSMHHTCREAAQGADEPHTVSLVGDTWWAECDAGRVPVAEPRFRALRGRAAAPGAHNAELL